MFVGMGLEHIVSAETSGSFSVSAVIPENQRNKNSTYFDIEMEPGGKQTLEVTITNPTDREIIVDQSVNTAITNSNGVIDYSQSDSVRDDTLVNSLQEIATAADVIILSPKSSQTVEIDIQLTDEPFEGVILGGIHYQEKTEEEAEDTSGVNVKNNFAFVLGIQITVGDTTDIQPELELNDITPTQMNYRNIVTANIQNTNPIPFGSLTVDAKIYKDGDTKVYREEHKENMEMAPNSNFDFPISWENQKFEDGTYTLELTATANDETWNWTETFEISGSEELNEEAILDPSGINYIAIGIGIFLVVGIGGAIVFMKRRHRKEE